MNYVGVDLHKNYSVLCAVDEEGGRVREARIEGNAAKGFAQFFESLEGPSKAVLQREAVGSGEYLKARFGISSLCPYQIFS